MASAAAIVQSTPTLPYDDYILKVSAGSRAAQHGLPLMTFSNAGACKQRVSKSRRIQRIQTRAGLPVVSNIPVVGPIVNFVLSPAVLLGIYVAGGMRIFTDISFCRGIPSHAYLFSAIQFLAGFSRTTYSDTFANRVGLTTTWPILFLVSKAFRNNFKRALRR